jgi:hypothetical protein
MPQWASSSHATGGVTRWGWILILFVVLFLVPVDAGYYAVLRYRLGYHGLPFGPAAVVLVSLWLLAFMVFPLAILLFPDGRLISRRWGWVLRGYAVAVAWVAIAGLTPALAAGISGNIQVNSSGDVTGTGHLAHVPAALTAVAYVSIGAIWMSFVGHQVLGWRRAAGERRQQLKWLACGAAVTLCAGLLGNALSSVVAASRLVDRRFNRARYDADQTVTAFAARLKDAIDLDSVRDDLASTVYLALEPAHLSLWVSHRD